MEQPYDQTIGEIKRISGLVRARNVIELLNDADLSANPRSSRVGTVTDAIDESIKKTPEVFPFKTKGILLGASQYQLLERNRIKVTFGNRELEGILDGGHNALAIGMRILALALGEDSKKLNKVKTWEDFRSLWDESEEVVSKLKTKTKEPIDGESQDSELDFLIPIELIVPRDPEDTASTDAFIGSLLDICSARNNNVQLKVEARANQSGYFDYLKSVLPAEVRKNVEWKTNEGGTIKATDVVALTWIPLAVLQKHIDDNGEEPLPVDAPVPQNIYRSKGDCMARFERLMSSPKITREVEGKSELINKRVESALNVAKDLPELFDDIYAKLPDYYNEGGGKFRRITAVKKMNPEGSRTPKKTKFFGYSVDTNLPEGFVVPIVYGLRALMTVDENGSVCWATNPRKFLDKHLKEVVQAVASFIPPFGYDPQKFGKEQANYNLAVTAFENALSRSNA